MLFNRRGVKIFTEYDLRSTLENQLQRLESEIKTQDFSNDNKDSLVLQLSNEYKVKPLIFHTEDVEVSSQEELVPSNYFPNSGFVVRQGESYPKDVYTFFLPFDGDETLLRCAPSSRITWTEEVAIENGRVVFQIIDFRKSIEEIEKEKERIIDFLTKQSINTNKDIEAHNQKIEEFIRTKINEVESKKAEMSENLARLGKPASSLSVKRPTSKISQPTQKEEKQYDVFVSHASEDKDYVDLLAERLKQEGLEVWYDTFEISWADDLRPTIDNGLKNSKVGLVILSNTFLGKKKWTEYELNGLFAREKDGNKVVFPIWHKIKRDDVALYSPVLADRVAKISDNLDEIAAELKKILKK